MGLATGVERKLADEIVEQLRVKQEMMGYSVHQYAEFLGVKRSLLQQTLRSGKRLGPNVAGAALIFPDLRDTVTAFMRIYRERTETVDLQTAPAVRTSSAELQTVEATR